MSKIFALLAIALIVSGALVLGLPYIEAQAPATRSLAPDAVAIPSAVARARELAEQVNAPLSILFGLVSLFYSRRSYQMNRARLEAAKAGNAG